MNDLYACRACEHKTHEMSIRNWSFQQFSAYISEDFVTTSLFETTGTLSIGGPIRKLNLGATVSSRLGLGKRCEMRSYAEEYSDVIAARSR